MLATPVTDSAVIPLVAQAPATTIITFLVFEIQYRVRNNTYILIVSPIYGKNVEFPVWFVGGVVVCDRELNSVLSLDRLKYLSPVHWLLNFPGIPHVDIYTSLKGLMRKFY